MGIYKVQSNGKAPSGLKAGDYVVTGGGTYVITGVNGDGSYSSVMYNQAQTTYNYGGSYDKLGGGSGSNTATASGAAAADKARKQAETASEAREAENALEDYYLKLLDQALSSSYKPVTTSKANKVQTISFDEAVELAEQAMSPQYAERYQQAADNAAQRLDQAGLYDTLYGQSLAAEAENTVSRDLNAAIYALALQLSDASADDARQLLELAVQERQFGAQYDAEQKQAALSYLLKLLQG